MNPRVMEAAMKSRQALMAVLLSPALLLAGQSAFAANTTGCTGSARRAADTEQPRLRMAHRWRRQPQCDGRRCSTGSRRAAPTSRGCRCCGCRASASTRTCGSTSSRPTCSPAASSIWSRTPSTKRDSSISDPDGVDGTRQQQEAVTVRTRPNRSRRPAARVFHVYPPGFKGTKIEPAFEGLMCAYNITCVGHRWATAPAAREARRHHPRPRRPLQIRPLRIYTNDLSISTVPFDGTYYLTASGTAEKPIAIKARGRRRGDFRRQRRFQLLQRQGRGLQLLRRPHVPQHRDRHLGRHAVHCRARKA